MCEGDGQGRRATGEGNRQGQLVRATGEGDRRRAKVMGEGSGRITYIYLKNCRVVKMSTSTFLHTGQDELVGQEELVFST